MSEAIRNAWDTVFRRYFCPKTELLYDFVVDEIGSAWHHLPEPEQIRENIPNPCGWGTGMEDSVLNGATAIDALISAYEITDDSAVKPTVDALFRGILRCVRQDGFIARSVSPADGESHYIESSRDQYTHWVYAALRLYDSELCDAGQQRAIAHTLEQIARRCEREVTPENDFHLLREDGTVGKVCKMWGDLGIHEWFRLPMFYLAAYHVTGDTHWKNLYLTYRDEALQRSSGPLPRYRIYTFLQMQYSLRAVYDLEDESFRSKLRPLMEQLTQRGEEAAVRYGNLYASPEKQEKLYYRFSPWDKIKPLRQGIFNGYNYDNPAQSERQENESFYPTRSVGEGALLAALCPGRKIKEETLSAVEALAKAIDHARYSNIYAPLFLSCGYIACIQNRTVAGSGGEYDKTSSRNPAF